MRLNAILIIVLGLALAFAMSGTNDLLGGLAVVVLALGVFVLWRPDVSPVFMFVFVYQWMQASMKIFQADILGVPIDEVAQFGGNLELATALSLAGLAALAIGMRMGLRSASTGVASTFRLDDKPPLYWFWTYAVAFAVAFASQQLAYAVPGLSQPLLALASLKWAFYWLLAHVAITRGGIVRWLWAGAFVVELGLGVTGYFSDFKTVLFFTLFALLSSGIRISGVRLLGMTVLFLVAACMAIAWTAIKVEQRRFLSTEENAQVVNVSTMDSMRNLVELASRLDAAAMVSATERLAARIAYVDFFAKVLDTVPEDIPYENGAIWADAVARPFMPRILFPSKTVIDDSERTNTFTRLNVMGLEEGVSISLGYMAESYIDFGPYLMVAPVLVLGALFGWFYRWLVDGRTGHRMVNIGLASAVLFPAAYLETSITKLFGGLVVAALVAWAISRFLVPMMFAQRPAGINVLRP